LEGKNFNIDKLNVRLFVLLILNDTMNVKLGIRKKTQRLAQRINIIIIHYYSRIEIKRVLLRLSKPLFVYVLRV